MGRLSALKGYLLQASLVEVYDERVQLFRWVKRLERAKRCIIFMAVRKSKKLSCFLVYSFFKDSTFTAVERDTKFQTK